MDSVNSYFIELADLCIYLLNWGYRKNCFENIQNDERKEELVTRFTPLLDGMVYYSDPPNKRKRICGLVLTDSPYESKKEVMQSEPPGAAPQPNLCKDSTIRGDNYQIFFCHPLFVSIPPSRKDWQWTPKNRPDGDVRGHSPRGPSVVFLPALHLKRSSIPAG